MEQQLFIPGLTLLGSWHYRLGASPVTGMDSHRAECCSGGMRLHFVPPETTQALPYVTLGPWELGPITIHAFGLLVAIGVLVAYEIAVRRAKRLGLEMNAMRSLLAHLLVAGFIGAHVFDVLFYQPETLLAEPWRLFWLPGSLSSYGGIAGALIGLVFWSRKHRTKSVLAFADVAAFAVPFGWLFGRMGCALAHDHPGRLTNFPLAVDFGSHGPGGIRHDLGLYEMPWWLVIVAIFLLVDRTRNKRPGLYLWLLPLLYAPVRFLLDFLRAPASEGGDVRYFALTPAQYVSIAAFTAGLVLAVRWIRRRPARPMATALPEPVES